jgi:hypothetical protein
MKEGRKNHHHQQQQQQHEHRRRRHHHHPIRHRHPSCYRRQHLFKHFDIDASTLQDVISENKSI